MPCRMKATSKVCTLVRRRFLNVIDNDGVHSGANLNHTGKNPLRKVTASSEDVKIIRNGRQRRLHKAFLRYHDAQNWPLLREALNRMGRADLIGNGKRHLVPAFQPAGTAAAPDVRGHGQRRR